MTAAEFLLSYQPLARNILFMPATNVLCSQTGFVIFKCIHIWFFFNALSLTFCEVHNRGFPIIGKLTSALGNYFLTNPFLVLFPTGNASVLDFQLNNACILVHELT